MASFGGLDSVDEHLSCGLEVAEGSVAEQRTGNEAPQISPYSNASAGQVSTRQDNEHSGIEGDCSPGLCDKRPLMQGRDGQCTGNGDFECEGQNEANASNFGREGLSSEFRVGDLPNGDEMALDLTSGIGCQDNPSENGMRVNVPQLKGIKIVEETVVITLDSPAMNDHFGSNPIETTPADSVDENVNDVAEVQTDTCNMKPYPQTSEMPRENVLSLGYVDEENTKHEDKSVSGLPIEAVEATLVVDMDNLKLFSNDTDIAADNLCSTDSLCYAVLETVQEYDRSVQCLSSEEASGEKTRKTGIEPKVEAETCIETPFFQVNELPVEEKTVNILLLHEQLSDDDDTGTMCSRINETNIGNILEADSQNDRSILLLHKMPCRQSSIPDCKTDLDQLNEKKADGLLSGMSAEMFSGMNDVKIDEMSCQILPSKDDRGASEGLHDSSLLSNSAQVSDREGSNRAAETNVEHVEEENTCPLGKFNKNSTQSFHFKKLTVNFKSLSEGSPGLQSCEPHPTTKNCSAKSSNDLGLPCEIAAAATTSSAANDDPGKKNDEGKHDGESECVPETESPVVTTSSSGRSSRVNKSGRKTQAKRASRYTKNARKMVQHHEALELIFKAAKKKRTYSSKTARPSTWGVMQNISQYFKHMDVLAIEPAQKEGTRKVRIGYGSGKQRRDRTGGTSQASKEKVGGSSNRICLKVKMGKRVISEVVNAPTSLGSFASASCGGSISDVANLANDFKEKNQLGCIDAMLDTGKLYHGDSLVNVVPNLIAEESVQDGGGCFDPTVDETGLVRAANDDKYLGSETSPDSEVINLKSEAQVSGRRQGGINSVALDSSRSIAACEHVLNARKGKKQDKVPCQSSGCRKDKSLSESSSSMRSSSRGKVDGSLNSGESLPLFNESDLACFKWPFNIESDANTCPGQDISIGSMHLEHLKNEMLSSAKKKGQKQVKRSKSGRESRGRSRGISSTKSRKGASCKQKKDSRKSTSRSKVQEKGVHNQFPCKAEDHALAVNGGRDCDQKSNTAASMWTDDTSKMEIASNSLVERRLPPRNAWVRCDDCHKWRRIAAQLADSIENSNSKWICKDNSDKRFADCLIPQEMSNADINAELDLSDYSCEDDDYDGNRNCTEIKCSGPTVPQQSSFVQIDSNKFLHRSRRIQTIDEVMVCHCRPPLDGKLGCGDECLNRMLNIECVQGTCPCGDLCSNQQFQKRKYAKLQWFRCGKKGYGLQLLEDVSKGKFIIEYVGEVLDVPAHDERQRDYAARGHKHFYFMTLNGSEVIDACIKGNLGRFINHSCDPNCRTEKWMVNGEICIGLFAIRDIKKGEEVTFDYNYVRVFGAAAKKCVCGSPQCQGYIGGDLQSTETIVQGDSDDEFPEPVMLHEDGDVAYRLDTAKRQTVGGSDMLVTDLLLKDKSEVIKRLENTLGSKDPRSQLDVEGRAEKALPLKPHQELSVHSKDIGITPLPELKQMISTEKDASNLNFTDTVEMSEPPGRPVSDEKWDLTEVHPPVKAPGSSGTVKKGKGSSNSQKLNKGQGLASKSQMVPIKTKNSIDGSANGRFEAVQEKLNELLDADGGISKRKDAPKGYLKLLLLTAASGDSGNGEAIQSNRDLSMILDALIKTRSRVVLMDIINKNGLRMLHNIMKQYRRDFKKIPILRKLLKVLEYLAVREILTLERINVDPPCPGMESFRESILSLTEHDDKQVHQIARNFRDRWIPRHLRKVGCADWGNSMSRGLNFNFMDCHSDWRGTSLTRPVEATNCLHQPSVSATTSSATDNSSIDGGSTSGTQTCKRKTRWDSDTNPYLESIKRRESLSRVEDGKENNYEEAGPPGFSSPLDTSRVSCSGSLTAAVVDQSSKTVQYLRCPFDAVIGQPQERFKSQSPVSYGVPLLILQQFGTPQAGSTESWAIAPGMPFHPFPPLPPFPRDRKCRSPPSSSDCRTNSDNSLHSSADEKKAKNLSQSTSCSNSADSVVPCSENQLTMPSKRLRLSSHDLGQRYFRQQKWNSTKMPPPWVRNCWRSNPSGGSRPALNEQRSSEDAIDCKLGREDSNYHPQMPPIWNHHH